MLEEERIKALKRIEQAHKWICDNPKAWLIMQEYVINQERDKRVVRLMRNDVYKECMLLGISVNDELQLATRDNNMWSALSRYLIKYHPQLQRVIKPKKCNLDKISFPDLDTNLIYKSN